MEDELLLWLLKTFDLPEVTPETVGLTIGIDKRELEELKYESLLYLLFFDMYEKKETYIKNITLKQRYFLVQLKHVYHKVHIDMEITESIYELWDRS